MATLLLCWISVYFFGYRLVGGARSILSKTTDDAALLLS